MPLLKILNVSKPPRMAVVLSSNVFAHGKHVVQKYTRLINKLEILDAIDKTIVENLIDSLIDKRQSGVSAMETSRIS